MKPCQGSTLRTVFWMSSQMFKKKNTKQKTKQPSNSSSQLHYSNNPVFYLINKQTWQQPHLLCWQSCLELSTFQINFAPGDLLNY